MVKVSKHGAGLRHLGILAATLVALAGCGGGGGGGGSSTPTPTPPPPPPNSAPSAGAGTDQTVTEGDTVSLSGTGTDANAGDTLTYSWAQTAGPDAGTISDADQPTATFVAPQVNSNQVLTFELTVSDGTASDTDDVSVTVRDQAVAGNTAVSGKVQFEFVPANNSCFGLNFAATELRPVRQATVQLLDGSGGVIESTTTNDSGDYVFSPISDGTSAQVRVLAELKRTTGASRWDVEIRDNVVSGQASPPALENRPKYALDGSLFTLSAGTATQDLVASTGWDGSAYTGPRAAAPFSVLDTIYSGIQLVLTVDPNAQFAPLDTFWSANNALVDATNIDEGELGSSFYRPDLDSIFLTGDPVNGFDTEEFDINVIVHEWGHYFEDNLARSDSIGGGRVIREQLDARLAWSEGWATSLSGMVLGNDVYCDTNFSSNNTGGFGIGLEDGSYDAQGWYDEVSTTRFIFDLFDPADPNDVYPAKDPTLIGDPVALGFQPIYETMASDLDTTDAFATVFAFATLLRANLSPSEQVQLDDQLRKFDMNPVGLDVWGSNETNDASVIQGLPNAAEGSADVLPLYTDLPTDGTAVNVCANSIYDSGRTRNKLASWRYLRANVTTAGVYDISVTLTNTSTPLPPDDPADARDQSDPDVRLYNEGVLVAIGTSGVANDEIFATQTSLVPGVHVMDVTEFRYADTETATDFPDRVCWDITMAPQ